MGGQALRIVRNGEREDSVDDRIDRLRGHLRSSLRMARLLLDEVLDTAWQQEDPEAFRNLAGKAGGELAMLLRMARRALPDDADGRTIMALARDLAPLARAPQVRRLLLLRPSRAPMHTLAHFCLEALGLPDARLDRVARMALTSSAAAANERVPYRLLDAAWTRHLAFGDAELEHPAIALSPLGAGVDLLDATVDDAYAYTHALPYATDFGRVPLPETIDRMLLLGTAEAIAVKALDEDDLDLLAEVLMAPAILRCGWTPMLAFAWHVLDRAWSEFGFVPGPGLPPAESGESRPQAVRRVLGTVYHTTFAAGLCCATLLAQQCLPPALPKGLAGDLEPPCGHGSAWQVVWRGLPRSGQQELRFLGLAFALRRAVEAADFLAMRDVAKASARAGCIEHPLFVQALEAIERAVEA